MLHVLDCRTSVVLCLVLSFVVISSGCAARLGPEEYAGVAAKLQAQGRLRSDVSPPDAPYTTADLVKNFRDIALFYEIRFRDGQLVHQATPKPLQKWRGAIRYKLIGDAVQPADVAEVDALVTELGALTGLRFTHTSEEADMLISIASPEGQREISRYLAESEPTGYRFQYDIWRRTPGWICGVTLATDAWERNRLRGAHVFMGSEVTGIMRRLCLHEEITQALGLTNDSGARPSIFNDDQEFALLTDHDRLLLRTLYDPRLRPGMTESEAMPLAEQIIGEFAGIEPTTAPGLSQH